MNPRSSSHSPPRSPAPAPTAPHRHEPLVDLTERLRAKARRVTGPRQAILEILRQQPHPLTVRDIYQALPARDCDLATVYRALHLLEEMAMVARFDFGDGTARFELVRPGAHDHHHHLICIRCRDVVEIETCFPAELEHRIAETHGFAAVTHKLEFFGVCPECRTVAS